jgi:hypothetical protein
MGWLHAISTNGKYRHLQDRQIAAALSIHTLTSQVSEGVCTKCGEMDSLTHYEACQYPAKQLIWQLRHNYIRDSMWTVINKDETKKVIKEPRINHNNYQRGDIQVEVTAGDKRTTHISELEILRLNLFSVRTPQSEGPTQERQRSYWAKESYGAPGLKLKPPSKLGFITRSAPMEMRWDRE